jgi:hypothetical protein
MTAAAAVPLDIDGHSWFCLGWGFCCLLFPAGLAGEQQEQDERANQAKMHGERI